MSQSNNIKQTTDDGYDMQQAVIGIILAYPQKINLDDLFKKLPVEAFGQATFRSAYKAAIQCHTTGVIPELMAVTDIVEHELSNDTPVFQILAELARNSSGHSNLMHYADSLVNYWRSSRITNIMSRALHDAEAITSPVERIQHFGDTINKITKYQNIAERSELLLSGSQGFDFNVDWMIKGWVPAESLGMIYGPSGSFKSFHVLDWAASIACGIDWSGNKTSSGAVLYIAGEGQAGVAKRIKAWEIVNKTGADNLYRVNRAMNLTDNTDRRLIISTCAQIKNDTGHDVKLIVIDTVNRCFGDGDENSTQDMTAFVSGCDLIMQQTKSSIMCVHHTGKDSTKGARGSSVLRAACDYEYSINRLAAVRGYQLNCTKAKDFEVEGVNNINLAIVELGVKDEDGKNKSSLARRGAVQKGEGGQAKSAIENACIEFLETSGGEAPRAWLNDQILATMEGGNDEANKAQIRRMFSRMQKNDVITISGESIYLVSELSINECDINRF